MSNARSFLILLCSRTSTEATRLWAPGRQLPNKSNSDSFIICSRNSYAGPNLHHSCTPRWDRRRGGYGGGPQLPHCTGACLPFLILCSRTSSAWDAFRFLLLSTRTPTTLPYCTGACLFNIVHKNEQCARRI